eukprot:Opistho-1_new@82592
MMGKNVDIPALRANRRQIGQRCLGSRQHDQRGLRRDRLAGRHHHHLHIGFQHQRVEVVEVRDARQDRAGDQDTPLRPFDRALQPHRILAGQPRGGGQPVHQPIAGPEAALLDLAIAVREQRRVAAELVDDEAADHRGVLGIDHRAGADHRCDHAAAVDIADQHHRDAGGPREAHIGDVACAQVDLRRRSRALDHDDVACRVEPPEALHHLVEQCAPRRAKIAAAQRSANPSMDDQLRAMVGLWLEQHRVHVGMRLDPAGDRLKRLCPPDLSAIDGDGGVVRHVLRFEGEYAQPAIGERAAQSGDQHRLADVGPGSLQHQRTHAATPAISHSAAQARR